MSYERLCDVKRQIDADFGQQRFDAVVRFSLYRVGHYFNFELKFLDAIITACYEGKCRGQTALKSIHRVEV